MRETLAVKMICASCNRALELDDEKRWDSDGAHNVGVLLRVRPCPVCVGKFVRAAQMVSEGLAVLTGRPTAGGEG